MKKITFLFLILFFSSYSFCQSGKVVYSVRIDFDANSAPKNIIDKVKKINQYASFQKFELSFNKNQASFKLMENMNKDENYDVKYEKIARGLTSHHTLYYDSNKEIEVQDTEQGVIIKDDYIKKKWEISTQSKMIDKNQCYKAIQKINFVNRKGEKKTKEIIAWFAPSLPYGYGPKNFHGLPGLILELTENKTTYLATKITLNQKEIQIIFPKGKTITKDEYDKQLKAQMGM